LEADQTSSIIYHNPFLALSIQQQRQRLPISKYRNQLLYLVEKYKTVVVVGYFLNFFERFLDEKIVR